MKMIGHGKNRWEYLLRADFGGANSGAIANGTSVETASSGSVQDGTLTAVDPGAGTIEVLSNQLKINNGTSGWTCGAYSGAVTRGRGLTLLFKITTPATFDRSSVVSFSSNQTLTPNYWGHALFISPSSGIGYRIDDNAGTESFNAYVISSPTANTQYLFSVLLGGYSADTPWDGSASGYDEGGCFFYTSGSVWKLGYKSGAGSASTLYVNVVPSGRDWLYDDIAIPNADLSHLLKPNNLSTSVSTTDTFTHYSDCFIEMLITTRPSSGNLDLEIRRQDDSNKWIARATSAGAVSLQEVVATSETPRITGGSISNGQRLVVIADDTTIKLFSDDTAAGSPYTSASNFSNDTGGKIVFGSGAVAHIADYPIGNNGEYNDLERF